VARLQGNRDSALAKTVVTTEGGQAL